MKHLDNIIFCGVILCLLAGGITFAALAVSAQTPAPPDIGNDQPAPAPPEAVQVFVWFIPSDCRESCGEHWVYMLWQDGGVWRRLCDADDCGPWEPLQ